MLGKILLLFVLVAQLFTIWILYNNLYNGSVANVFPVGGGDEKQEENKSGKEGNGLTQMEDMSNGLEVNGSGMESAGNKDDVIVHSSASSHDPSSQSLSGHDQSSHDQSADPSSQSLSGHDPSSQSLSGHDPSTQSLSGQSLKHSPSNSSPQTIGSGDVNNQQGQTNSQRGQSHPFPPKPTHSPGKMGESKMIGGESKVIGGESKVTDSASNNVAPKNGEQENLVGMNLLLRASDLTHRSMGGRKY